MPSYYFRHVGSFLIRFAIFGNCRLGGVTVVPGRGRESSPRSRLRGGVPSGSGGASRWVMRGAARWRAGSNPTRLRLVML